MFLTGTSSENHIVIKSNMKHILLSSITGLALSVTSLSAAYVDLSKLPPASTKKGVTYAADIQPLFEKSCFKCHGSEKQKGKLRLDSLESALKGGENGKIIEPGTSTKSKIVIAVARLGEEDDGGHRRAQVVRDFDHQVEAVGPRQP